MVTFFVPVTGHASDDGAGQLLGTAQGIYQGEKTPIEDLTRIMSIFDEIIESHPSSDIAVKILLREQLGELDIDEIARLIAAERNKSVKAVPHTATPSATLPQIPVFAGNVPPTIIPDAAVGADKVDIGNAPVVSAPLLPVFPIPDLQADQPPSQSSPNAPPPPALSSAPPATEASERLLSLDKRAIRDVQARLLVLGFDPNGVDGAMGRGSRAAVRAWQVASGLTPSGFLDAGQLQILKTASQAALDQWLRDPKNRQLHDPVVVPLTPTNVSGNWTFTANCGRNSRLPGQRITGVLAISFTGGSSFSGTLVNSQGLRAKVAGTVRGRRIDANINFGLLFGASRFSGAAADNALIIRGSDSNRCSITIRKR